MDYKAFSTYSCFPIPNICFPLAFFDIFQACWILTARTHVILLEMLDMKHTFKL